MGNPLAALPLHRVTARPAMRRSLIVNMARTESVTLDVGFKAPEFALPEPLTGKTVSLYDYTSGCSAAVIMIICNHCPFVIHLKPAIVDLAKEYEAKGVKFIAISSNSVETHPQDGPERMAEDAKTVEYTFPYLFDEDQSVAKAYQVSRRIATVWQQSCCCKENFHRSGIVGKGRPAPLSCNQRRRAMNVLLHFLSFLFAGCMHS